MHVYKRDSDKMLDRFRLADTKMKLGVKHKTESSEDLPVNCLNGVHSSFIERQSQRLVESHQWANSRRYTA